METQTTIERNFQLLLDSIVVLKEALSLSFYDAFLESCENLLDDGKVRVLDGLPKEKCVLELEEIYRQLLAEKMSSEDSRKLVELVLLKGMKEEPLQQNHQLTPQSINVIFAFLLEQLFPKEKVKLLDVAVGSGNLLLALVNALSLAKKEVVAVGVDNDEMMLAISFVNASLAGQKIELIEADSVTKEATEKYDVALGDLPVGYYPNDSVASDFLVHESTEKTYAHHLFVEQAMQQLEESGFGIFLLPSDLLTTPQTPNFIRWLKKKAYLQAVIEFPEQLFQNKRARKSLYIFQNQNKQTKQAQVFAYFIRDLKEKEGIFHFMKNFKTWVENLS